MTEMIVTEFNTGAIFKYLLINILALFIFLLIFIIKNKISKYKISKKAILILFSIFIVISLSINSVQILYIYDHYSNNVIVKNIEFNKLSSKNHTYCFTDNDIIYYFDVGGDKEEQLKEFFVGHDCTIEYYKWSKMVWKIKLIE